MLDFSNSDFDVNILEDPLGSPVIPLTFPLPTDKETYVDLDSNEKVSHSWSMLSNFIHFFTGVDWDNIYHSNEYKYSINKYSPSFNKKIEEYMRERLEVSDEKLDEHIENLVNQELRLNLIKGSQFKQRFEEVKKFMVEYYSQENKKNLPKFIGRNFLRVCYVTIMKLMQKMFPEGIWCNREQISNLYNQYLQNPMSIIYLPNHQSHIDYIVIHLLAIRFQMSTPVVIAGDNLNVAVFGSILKGLGAIYIKRSFNNELYTERNLSNFIEFILLNKISFEVFIEGTRSRDGKLLLPKYGILKTLCNIYIKQREIEENTDFDMRFAPIAVTYEKIYESDGYLRELMGKDKKQESMKNIFKNGISNLFGKVEEHDHHKFVQQARKNKGDYDNSNRNLHGKVFVKFGESFKLSDFIADDEKNSNFPVDLVPGSQVNLKKLGFKVLHEINRSSFLPEISIIGSAIQTHYNLNKKSRFPVTELIPIMRLLMETFHHEESKCNNVTNVRLLKDLLRSSDANLVEMIKQQIPLFFREVKVNFLTDDVIINDSMELLYYKNLTIHIIIHKSLASFLLLSLPNDTRQAKFLHKLFYIFTGFLKNEFLFDYDYNPEHQLSNILQDLTELGNISKDENNCYIIENYAYLNIFSEIVKPFIESYSLCIYNIYEIITQFNEKHGLIDIKKLLIDDEGIDYPHTKTLLKLIQSKQKSEKLAHVESTNKQYLLSCLYYLNNLRLIEIHKNKTRTKAFVLIENAKDLLFVYNFLNSLIKGNSSINETKIGYMTDIIDKVPERVLEEVQTPTPAIVDVKLKSRL